MAPEAVKDWKELKGINQDEFNKRFETGEFDKFMNDKEFVEAHTSKALFEKAPDSPPPDSPPASDPPRPSVKEEPWYRQKGYDTEEEYQNAVENMRGLVEKKQGQIDQFNAERGQVGEKSKERIEKLENELAEAKTRLTEAEKRSAPGAVEVPEMPSMPVPEDGDYNSDDYQRKLRDYREKVQEYNKKRREFDSGVFEKLNKSEKTLSDLRNKTTVIEGDQKSQSENRRQEIAQKAWGHTLSQISELQEFDPKLKTSKPFEEINRVIRTRGYEEAAKLYPKKDIENFDRICDVIKEYQYVDEKTGNIDYAQSPRHNSIKAAFYNLLDREGKLDEFLHNAKTEGKRKGREEVIDALHKKDGAAKPLPSGGEERPLLEEETQDEVVKKLKEYSKREYDAKLDADPAFRKEVYDLMNKAGEKDPHWLRMIPSKWREEFSQKK